MTMPAPEPTHRPCCSSHGVDMTCERYRRTHFVEVRPCCSVDAELLRDESEPIAGAVLALGYATDETTARYWLAVCARRGADQRLLAQLWEAWQDDHAPTVIGGGSTRAPRCTNCDGPLGGAQCPLCDPRPISVDRAAGCVCDSGRGRPIREWNPVPGCPVHNPDRREDTRP